MSNAAQPQGFTHRVTLLSRERVYRKDGFRGRTPTTLLTPGHARPLLPVKPQQQKKIRMRLPVALGMGLTWLLLIEPRAEQSFGTAPVLSKTPSLKTAPEKGKEDKARKSVNPPFFKKCTAVAQLPGCGL